MQQLSVILKYVYTRYSVQPLGGHVYSVHTLYKQCIVERRFTHVSSWLRYNWAAVYVWCVRLIAKYLLPIRPNNTRSYLRIITWCRIGPTLFVCCSDRTHCNSRTRIGFMLSEIMSRHSRHTGCRIMLTIGENSGFVLCARSALVRFRNDLRPHSEPGIIICKWCQSTQARVSAVPTVSCLIQCCFEFTTSFLSIRSARSRFLG